MHRTILICAAILAICGCEGATGPAGAKGDRGDPGTQGDPGDPATVDPSISAVTPTAGYLGRTIDVVVSGNGTAWAGDAMVSFSDPAIKVNNITAASETGLLVNITIPPDAAEGPVDVMVTDMIGTETYKGAFKVASPIDVTVEPAMGLPQGGIAQLHVRMLDTTTPFDDEAMKVLFESADVALVDVTRVTPFGMDVLVQCDVLAAAKDVGLAVMSGPDTKEIVSPRKIAFPIVARASEALVSEMPLQAELKDAASSLLYSYAPADANTHFIQMGLSTFDGFPVASLLPKSGKLADLISSFDRRFAIATTSTDPFYLIVRNGPFGSSLPYGVDLFLRDTLCTAMTETAGNIDPTTANAIATLPALVSGDLLDGMAQSDDWFKIDVTGASAMTPKTIHVATGGDALSDMIVEVFDTDSYTPLGYTEPDAMHKNFGTEVTVDGTYYMRVTPSYQFDAAHSAYQILVEVL